MHRVHVDVGVFDTTHAEQKRFDLAGVVVAHGQHHARFGDAVVGRILTDDGVAQQVLNLVNACLSRQVGGHEVVVVVHEVLRDFDAAP